MNAGNYRFKLNWSSLWHLWQGWNRLTLPTQITISRAVLILDVSKWQGSIDFERMKAEGVDGVIIKCGQGAAKDLRFDENWRKAKAAGLPRGTYWFWDSRYPPKSQAENWWNWIKADVGELGHYGDYEESYGGPYGGWKNFKLFMDDFGFRSRLPIKRRGIYTGYYYFIANSPTTKAELAPFKDYPLWEAWYSLNPAYVRIPLPWVESDLAFWQYGTPPNGVKYGAESRDIDENNYNGDEWAYKERFGLDGSVILPPVTPPPAIEPEPEPGLWNATVLVNGLYIRKYPVVVDGTKILVGDGYLQVNAGEKFSGRLWVGNGYVWMQIDSAARPELVGRWAAVRTESGVTKFMYLVRAIETVPPVELPELWQHKEDKGVYGYIRICAPCPAVFPMTGDIKTEITEQWQYYVRAVNYGMSLQYVAALFGAQKAFTNRKPETVCADWLRRRDLDKQNPWWDKVRTTSRSVMTGRVEGGYLRVEVMDGTRPPALKPGYSFPRNVDEIDRNAYLYMPETHRHLFAVANIVNRDGRVVPFANGAVYPWTGDGKPYTFIPHIARVEVLYPLGYLIQLPAGSAVPGPYS